MLKHRGFTLIELMIVIAIIGVLAMVSVSTYIGAQKRAARSEAYSNLENLRLVEEQQFAENATYVAAAGALPWAALPRFQPGAGANYTYVVTISAAGAGIALTVPVAVPYAGATTPIPNAPNPSQPCFIATATGIAGTRVCPDAANCDVFAIDCMNNRNF